MFRSLILITGLASQAYVQAATGGGNSPASPSSITCHLTTKFDKGVAALPAGFCGHNPDNVISALRALPLSKDAYETSSQYANRIAKVVDKPLYANVLGTDLLAFMAHVNAKYDADKGGYQFMVPLQLLSNYKWALELSEVRAEGEGYTGQNAFGVKRKVSTEARRYVVLQSKHTPVSNESMFAHVKVARDVAQKLDGHKFALLYVGKLSVPYLWADKMLDHATLNSPIDRVSDFTVLGFSVNETWLYDVTTGKIVSKSVKNR